MPITIKGQPGERVGLFFSSASDHRLIGIDAPLLVSIPQGPPIQRWMYLGAIDSSGTLVYDLPVRDLPHLGHVKLHLVASVVGASGRRFTNSVSPILLDSAW